MQFPGKARSVAGQCGGYWLRLGKFGMGSDRLFGHPCSPAPLRVAEFEVRQATSWPDLLVVVEHPGKEL